jgi:DNA-binding transcriptional ArsR family regulator
LPGRDPRRELARLEAVFAALAHASRRHILRVLHHHGGSMTAGEIAARFDCTWPTTTRHLRRLEEAGLVRVEKEGRERIYRLDLDTLRGVAGQWLGGFDGGG